MAGDHSILAPSAAPIWGHCSGSVQVMAAVPDTWTPESEEGTAAHWVASECLAMWAEPGEKMPVANFWLGQQAPNGVIIDEDIAEAVQVYVDHIVKLAQQHGALRSMRIEHRVHAPQIHPELWGTSDFCLWLPDSGTLIIRDYKHGHRLCRAEGNLQLVAYAAGMLAELNINGYQDQHVTVDLGIVQPRCYHSPAGPISTWRTTLADLRGYFNQLEHQAAEAFSASPKLSTGEHCRDCPGVLSCRAARMASYSLADYVRQPFAMDSMTAEELATERAILEPAVSAARARLEAAEADLRHRITSGQGGKCGLTVESTPGRAKWGVPDDTVRLLGQQFGVDAMRETPVTPAQFVKAVPAPMRAAAEQVVKQMAPRPAGALKLVDAADSRTARAFKPKEE